MKATKIAKRAAVNRLRIWERWFSLLCLPILLGAMLDSAGAQGLSSHAITIVVPYSPGTGPDVIARNIGEALQPGDRDRQQGGCDGQHWHPDRSARGARRSYIADDQQPLHHQCQPVQ